MPKNIVVYSDGTGQDGGARPEQRISNIYKMYRISRDHADTAIDPSQQVVFYDAGLGTDVGTTALTAPVRFVQKLLGSVTGAGIKRNIADCYEFIINHYQSGDRIFLFGFSRGAYTVRSLANLLMLCGVPTKAPAGPVMRFRKAVRDIAWEAVDTVLEHGAGHPRAEFEDERVELARRFQVKYGSGDGLDSNAAPYFIGVFDTVAALGAKGMRYLVIQAGLSAGVSLAAFIGGFLPALAIAALSAWIFGTGFMIVGFLVQLAIVAVANVVFWRWQTKSTTKTITDYPVPGQSRSHQAIWKGENFDRLLSRHVAFARAANAIDETRKDFDRVGWGGSDKGAPVFPGHTRQVQHWFAGNHSDVGGSYPEPESRLSDVALHWMCEEAISVPDGLKTGPICVDGKKLPNTGEVGPALNIFPAADGVQHCEVAGMRDTLDAYAAKLPKWDWLQRYVVSQNWETKIRDIDPAAPVDPTVTTRAGLPAVIQCATVGPYRPEALRNHNDFKQLYLPSARSSGASPSGRLPRSAADPQDQRTSPHCIPFSPCDERPLPEVRMASSSEFDLPLCQLTADIKSRLAQLSLRSSKLGGFGSITTCCPSCYGVRTIHFLGTISMASIPTGKFDFESEALKLYESDECERLFATARERFPGHNDGQMLDALDYIMDGLESAFAEGYTDEQWHSIADHLGEHVQNGLT